MDRPTRIYISSTFEDLKGHREVLYQTLRIVDVDARDSMEHDVARNERTVDACLRDVEACDIYIGIFAFRYGYVPKRENPGEQSITELEYCHAVGCGKPCLIFLAEPAGWPLELSDAYRVENENGKRIGALRKHFEGDESEVTPARFSSPDSLAKAVLETLIKRGVNRRTAARITWPVDKSPYPGMVRFPKDYTPVYFGRAAQVEEVLDKLKDPDCHLLIVSGASGSGKSSLVAAGVIPQLEAGALGDGCQWETLRFVPGENPFAALAASLYPDTPDEGQKAIASSWSTTPATLRDHVDALVQKRPSEFRALWFLDQMEELFTQTPRDQQAPFIEAITAAIGERVRVIGTVRSDFLGECERFEPLRRVLEARHQVALWRLGSDALLDMIRRPAAAAGLALDDGLAGQLLQDAGDEPGRLPLLAYTLRKLWERRQDGRLTVDSYAELGGIGGAVGHIADKAFEGLDGGERHAAFERVFPVLVKVTAEGKPTRLRAPLTQFAADAAALGFIRRFCAEDTRLLVTDRQADELDAINPEASLDVAHEALFESWKKLAHWINGRKDNEQQLAQAEVAGAEWRESGYARSRLWPAERSSEARNALKALNRQPSELGPDARELIFPEQRLLEELKDRNAAHTRRAEIGDFLAVLGDPRPGVGVRADGAPNLDAHYWVPVPGGQIALEAAKGTFTAEPCYIARYPVTYRQYRAFVEADDGYRSERWWDDLSQEDQPGQQYRPIDNCPAENVSWYDAMAYCRWLSEKLGYAMTLPTEQQWQQAATGGDRENAFPWGRDWDPEREPWRANTWESRLGRTTAVGMYPEGQTPQGIFDLAGNVWEWCLNKYDDPKDTSTGGEDRRVLRGGSWLDGSDLCRAAGRGGYNPVSRYYSSGFRLLRPPLRADH
jgi:hypothetical protein